MTGVRRRVLLFTSQDIGFQFADYLATRRDIELLVIADRTARDDAYGYRSAIDVCERNPFHASGPRGSTTPSWRRSARSSPIS